MSFARIGRCCNSAQAVCAVNWGSVMTNWPAK